MGTTTTNYSLYKPASGETGYKTSFDTGMDAIDTAVKAISDTVTSHTSTLSTHTSDIALRWRDLWVPFTVDGTLTVAAGNKRFPILTACSIQGVAATVNTAPVGASIILDINRNGTSVCSTRPQISAGNNAITTAAVFSSTALTVGQYLTIDVDQIGSGTAGSNLVVVLALRLT